MKKNFLFFSMVIAMTLMPQTIHAQSLLQQVSKLITDMTNTPSTGNQQNRSGANVYYVQPTTGQPDYNKQHSTTLQRNQSTTSQQKRMNNIIYYEVPRIRSIALYGDYFFYLEDNNNNAVIVIDRKTGQKSTFLPGIAGFYEGVRPFITNIGMCGGKFFFTLKGKKAVYNFDWKSVETSTTIEDATDIISYGERYALFLSCVKKGTLPGYDLWDMDSMKFIYTFGYEEIGKRFEYQEKPFIAQDGSLWYKDGLGLSKIAPGGKRQFFSLAEESYVKQNGIQYIEEKCKRKGSYIYVPCKRRLYRINTMSSTPVWEEYAKIPPTQDNRFIDFAIDSQGNMLTEGHSMDGSEYRDYNTQFWCVGSFNAPLSLGGSITTGFGGFYAKIHPHRYKMMTDDDDNFIFVNSEELYIYNPNGIVGYTTTVGKMVEK